jgi:hypothetical protein
LNQRKNGRFRVAVTFLTREDEMALLEDIVKAEGAGPLVLGVGALMLAPTLLPALGRMLRPVAKGIIKTGMTVYDETYSTMREATGDLIAEARAELQHEDQKHNGHARGGMAEESRPMGRAPA